MIKRDLKNNMTINFRVKVIEHDSQILLIQHNGSEILNASPLPHELLNSNRRFRHHSSIVHKKTLKFTMSNPSVKKQLN